MKWQDALDFCNDLGSGSIIDCGLSDGSSAGDWRLPNIRELQSLIDYRYSAPALPNTQGTGRWAEGDPFINVSALMYWSSTTATGIDMIYAWGVNIFDNFTDYGYKSGNLVGVWPVRGPN